MQKKQNRLWRFSKKAQNTSSTQQKQSLNPESSQLNLYRSIGRLPLNVFINCVVDKDYSGLVISGTATQSEFLEAWADLNSQYAEIMGDAEYKVYSALYKELAILTLKVAEIEAIIEVLSYFPYYPLFEKLNEHLSVSWQYDYSNVEEYEKLLKRAYNRSREFVIRLESKKIAFDSMQSKFKEGKPPTREYFNSMLISLSDHVKYRISDDITVFEFCQRVNNLSKHLEKWQTKG